MSGVKMRVSVVSVVPSPYQRDLFRALAARAEIELRVFYMEDESPDSPWPKMPLAEYESILPGSWLRLGAARVHVNRVPSLAGADVVVLNTVMSLTAQWLMRGLLRRRCWIFWAEKLGSRSWLHDMLTRPLRRAAAIVGIGSWAACDYRARFPGARVFNLPYHCDLAGFLATPRPREADGRTVFLFCGQMIARKGLDILLAAFSKLATERADVELLLVGRRAELPAEPGVRVRYAGFHAPEKLPELFAQADVFVLPSRYDGWGVVVNQAVAAGLPVICSDRVGAGHDLVEDGVNGRKFFAGDGDALLACLREFAADRTLVVRAGAASRERAGEWVPERGAEKWVRILQEVVAR